MILALFLIHFAFRTQAAAPIDLKPIFRQDGFIIPGYKGVCSIIPHKCAAHSTNCMIASCNSARGNVCFGVGKEIDSYCETWMNDIDNNQVAVPGVCIEGTCVHVPQKVHCQNGEIHAWRTFPSCGDVGFGKTFRFVSKDGKPAESLVIEGINPESFGPDLEQVNVTTSQTINDPGFGVATIRYEEMRYGDCIVGHSSDCKIHDAGTYLLSGMTVKWNPDSGDSNSRESFLEIHNQVIELRPRFLCSTDDCRTTIKMAGTSPTPCGKSQLICQNPCKYRLSGFETWPELNGDYAERVAGINNFGAYSKINSVITVAKALKGGEWWFDDDLSDYDSTKQTANVKAYLDFSATQNPFNSEGLFSAVEIAADGSEKARMIQIRQKCRSDCGPCGCIEALYSTHKFWSVAYGTVRFIPPKDEDASVKNPDNPYNMALLGDVVNYENAQFEVEVTFNGDMAGIVVFGSESSYVMCRLDSFKGARATGLSIVTHPNNVVVNGKQANGQLPNPENTPIRLKITIHKDVVTCYSSGFGEVSEIVPRVTYPHYTGTHIGRFGFVTLNAAASFRILGCPNNTPPHKPPCIPDSDSVDTDSTDTDSTDTDSASIESDSTSNDQDSIDTDSNDNDGSGGLNFGGDSDDDDGGRGNSNFFNFDFGGDSGDAEAKVGDDSDDKKKDSRADSSDSSDDPDKGPTCVPKKHKVPDGGSSSTSDSKESESDSFDVEAAIGVQTHSLSHAVFEDRILYLLASIGIAASLIVMYRLFCLKEDYEAVAEPELEEL